MWTVDDNVDHCRVQTVFIYFPQKTIFTLSLTKEAWEEIQNPTNILLITTN